MIDMKITPPETNLRVELASIIANSLGSSIPFVGGPISEIWKLLAPAQSEVSAREWQDQISNAVNNLETRLQIIEQSIKLSEDALFIAKTLCTEAGRGEGDLFDAEQLWKLFPHSGRRDIEEMLGELASYDLLDLFPLSNGLHNVRLCGPSSA